MKIITLLRKPLDGSVADNTLKHGCGGINIDGTRISTSDNLNGGAYAENPTERGGQDMWTTTRKEESKCPRRGGAGDYEQPTGRWAANFILTHLEGCELRGVKTIKENTANGVSSTTIFGGKGARKITHHADENGEAQVADWACVEGCPIQELDRQSGVLKSGGGNKSNRNSKSGFGGGASYDDYRSPSEGGASRFFMQFKKDNN